MGRPQDVKFQFLKDIGRGRPQDVGRGRTLALHRGPYGDVHRTCFGDVLRTSSGRNFAELDVDRLSLPRDGGRRGLIAIEHCVELSVRGLEVYFHESVERTATSC